MYSDIVVAGVVYRRIKDKYQFLLIRRIPEKENLWQHPGGTLETGDKSMLDGALRELYEETGITMDDVERIIKDVNEYEFNDNLLTGEKMIEPVKEYVFGFEVRPDLEITLSNNHSEHYQYKWVSLKQALKMLRWDNNKQSFRNLAEILGIKS